MSILIWILIYIVEMLFWIWLAFYGGAELLEGHWIMELLVHWGASSWSSESVKLVAWFFMFSTTVWFIVGLFDPNVRPFAL